MARLAESFSSHCRTGVHPPETLHQQPCRHVFQHDAAHAQTERLDQLILINMPGQQYHAKGRVKNGQRAYDVKAVYVWQMQIKHKDVRSVPFDGRNHFCPAAATSEDLAIRVVLKQALQSRE